MPDPVRVSVVIPVHNGERYVARTIGSALASDLAELEVIVVDDGSEDRSADIVRQIDDPRISLLQQKASGGPARPRNVAVAHARAPYVAFLDADDLLRPNKLSSAVAILDRHPEAGFAFGDFEHIDAHGTVLATPILAPKLASCSIVSKPVGDHWHLISQQELARGMLYRNFISTSGVIVRKSVLIDVGNFDESLLFSEDLDLWFRFAHRCDALYSETVGHSYRVAPGSLTYRPTARTASDRIRVLRRERERRQLRRERRQLDCLIAESLATLGYEHRRNRQRLPSVSAFAQAFVTHPDVRWMRALVGSLVA
jgi:glycosyltransferase involved in cell wall biosynthesis